MSENEDPASSAILEGVISVRASLEAQSRPVYRVLANRDKLPRGFGRLRELAEARRVPVDYCSAKQIDQLARGRSHGGVVATAGDRTFVSLDALVGSEPSPFLAMIDGVEDPYNFGQAVRSLHAAGATGLLLRPRNWMSAAGVVARASAGASELLPTAIAETVFAAAEFGLAKQLTVVLLDDRAGRSIYDVDLRVGILLLIGGEQRGVTRSFTGTDCLRVRIPYARSEAYSLGAAASASVAAFEVMRQRASQQPKL